MSKEDLTPKAALCPNCQEWKEVMVLKKITLTEAVEFCDFNEDGEAKKVKTVRNTGTKEVEIEHFFCTNCNETFDSPKAGKEIK